MSLEVINTKRGIFAVDWGVVSRLAYSYFFARYPVLNARLVEDSDREWFNPISYMLPTVEHIEVDWNEARRDAKRKAQDFIEIQLDRLIENPAVTANEVADLVVGASEYNQEFRQRNESLQRKNMAAIDSAVDDYDLAVDISTFVRDTSTEVVLVGATVVSGGAAAGLLAGGSVMKGVATYQDTGCAGGAAVTASTTLILGAFGLKNAQLSAAGEDVLLIAKAVVDAGNAAFMALEAGNASGGRADYWKIAADAGTVGAYTLVSEFAGGQILNSRKMKRFIEGLPVPTNIAVDAKALDSVKSMYNQAKVRKIAANAAVGTAVKKGLPYAGNVIANEADELVDRFTGQQARKEGAAVGTKDGLAAHVPLADLKLARSAIVQLGSI